MLPITVRSFEKDYHINGDNFERSYKETISGFKTWEDADHAEDWVIHPVQQGGSWTKGMPRGHCEGNQGKGGYKRPEEDAGSRPPVG